MSKCLKVNVTVLPVKLRANIGMFCGVNVNYLPLIVNEGYLFIDFKGNPTQLYVKKK